MAELSDSSSAKSALMVLLPKDEIHRHLQAIINSMSTTLATATDGNCKIWLNVAGDFLS